MSRWVVRWSCQRSDLYRIPEHECPSGEKKAVGELVEVVAVGLPWSLVSWGGGPAAAAKGLCEQCPLRWPGSELLCSYRGLKCPAVLLHTLHLGFTNF